MKRAISLFRLSSKPPLSVRGKTLAWRSADKEVKFARLLFDQLENVLALNTAEVSWPEGDLREVPFERIDRGRIEVHQQPQVKPELCGLLIRV